MSHTNIPAPIYITLRLDVLSGLMKELAETAHQKRDGVTVREVRLLLLVRDHPGLTISRLVELSFMEKTMVSKAVTELTRAGLIQRRIGQEDARQVALELTRKGKGVAERARQYVLEATDAVMSILPPDLRTAFDEALELLTTHVIRQHAEGRELLDPPPPQDGDTPSRSASKRAEKPAGAAAAAASQKVRRKRAP